MSVIAVAGGTGRVGRAIVEALVAEGKHKTFILSRETSETKAKEIGAPILAVDYNDINALTAVLETNKVEVVISTLDANAGAGPEFGLIQAADRSSATRRYIPNNWGIKPTEQVAAFFPPSKVKMDMVEALSATSLEYTAVYNGFFLDYFVAPKVKSYQPPMAFAIDIANNFAAIPGSGNVPVVFTHTFDVARFAAALVGQPRWEKETWIIGDKLTWNEFLRVAEEARGAKFTVVYDSLDKLKTGQITELPSHPHLYPFFPKEMLRGFFAGFGILFETGVFDFKPSRTLNDDFPEIKARTVKELVFEAWKE